MSSVDASRLTPRQLAAETVEGAWSRVFAEVQAERQRQDVRWGEQNYDVLYWLGIATEEFLEVTKAIIEYHGMAEVRKETIQLAAVAVAMVESLDRAADRQERATETTGRPSPVVSVGVTAIRATVEERAQSIVRDWYGSVDPPATLRPYIPWSQLLDLGGRIAVALAKERAAGPS